MGFSEGDAYPEPINAGYRLDPDAVQAPEFPPVPQRHYHTPPAEMHELTTLDECAEEMIRLYLAAFEASRDDVPQAAQLRAELYDRTYAILERAGIIQRDASDSPHPTTVG